MKDRLNELQRKNVFIHTQVEHYDDGSNVCFSIEFKDYKEQTGWYNDNHEFGDAGDVMKSAIELAEWYLENPERIKKINGKFDIDYNKELGKKLKKYLK